jgi:hypothetical protein
MIKALREAGAFFFHGYLCPRCKTERTGHWERYVYEDLDGDEEWVCDTCDAIERIRFRDAAAKRFNP